MKITGCKLCGSRKVRDVLFCEDCLSKDQREKTFDDRLIIVKNILTKRMRIKQ